MPDGEVRTHLAAANLEVNPGLVSKKSVAWRHAISVAARWRQIGRQIDIKCSNVNGIAHQWQSGVDSQKQQIAV
jgi:hypothetical protein